MKHILIGTIALLAALNLTAANKKEKTTTEITVLQWNIWQEGTMVPGGYDAIVEEIARLQPDFITFSEVRNYNGTRFCDRIVRSLAEKGQTWWSFLSEDTGLLSKHPIKDSTIVYPLNNDQGTIHRLLSEIDGQEYAIYTAHLDYRDCAYYNVRGKDGSTWEDVSIPQTVAEILQRNDLSHRDDAIRNFILHAKMDTEQDRIVILGGDFNEPSHLDWIRETKDLYDHHGFIIPWTVTLLLDNAGFIDTYRQIYPDVLDYPGFTFPSDNGLMPKRKLTWAPDADERERIDYIYYYPHPGLQPESAIIFGPEKSICRNRRTASESKDQFLAPLGTWPTDHKGLLVKFRLSR